MNERIKQLAFQAMSINQKVSDESFFVEVSKLKEFEKFAELLLEEMHDFIMDESAKDNGIPDFSTVKQHFGV